MQLFILNYLTGGPNQKCLNKTTQLPAGPLLDYVGGFHGGCDAQL